MRWVLAFARRTFAHDHDPAAGGHERELCFLGFVGLIDPPRDGVREAVAQCREADMTLLDDNFVTIVAAAREGRRVFDNIRRFVRYAMTGNSAEIWTLFLAPFLLLPVPLEPSR